MSEREFETYLTLLCRLLRLDALQREAIARELRDHLEERLAELKSHGVSHEEAVRLTLSEFGDAAGLAAEFTFIARNVKRKWLMRMTLASTVAAGVLAMAVMALWPDGARTLPTFSTAVAQDAAQPAESDPKTASSRAEAGNDAKAALAKRLDAEFLETPLEDVLAFLGDADGGQFYINQKRIADAGIALDSPITLNLKNVRADMVLDLALDQVSDQLAYIVRDGIVIVSTLEDLEGAAEVRVYNVRDLLKASYSGQAAAGGGMMGMMMEGMGAPGGGAGGGYGMSAPGGYGGEMGYGTGGYGETSSPAPNDRAQLLIQVITTAIGQQRWQTGGDYGTLAAFDGLLVVNHNTRVHQQVEQLLEMLRNAAREGEKKPPEDQDNGFRPFPGFKQ